MAEEIRIMHLKEVDIGNFIKFSGKDKQGRWQYIGEVVSKDEKFFKILFVEGLWGFSSFTDDEFYMAERPPWWEKFASDPEKYRNRLKGKEEKKKEASMLPMQKTIKEQVFDLVKENSTLTESKLFKLVKTSVHADDSILNNYILLAKTKLRRL